MHKKLKIFAAAALATAVFSSCAKKLEDPIIIWTDSSEFASYTELYNKQHNKKAVLVYKEHLETALPPASDEQKPDVIVGSWLKNKRTEKYFQESEFLFDRKFIRSGVFYKTLLQTGEVSGKQYLIPVSFNFPMVLYSKENRNLIEDEYTITIEQIRKIGATYNQKDKRDKFTRIGFAPQSNKDFLTLAAQIKGAGFTEDSNGNFTWNPQGLEDALKYISSWISTENQDAQTESDFVYKYLSMSADKRVTSGKTLFAYTTSDKLFTLPEENLANIEYLWIVDDGMIPAQDSMVMMGISKWNKDLKGSAEFISWFFSKETQTMILDRKKNMRLDNQTFGIAGGFSSLKEINEQELPAHYPTLLSNTPHADSIKSIQNMPMRWESLKDRVVTPYIKEYLNHDEKKQIHSLEQRYGDWKKNTSLTKKS